MIDIGIKLLYSCIICRFFEVEKIIHNSWLAR